MPMNNALFKRMTGAGRIPLKVLFVIKSLSQFSYMSSIVKSLDSSGHQIQLLFDPVWSKTTSDHVVRQFISRTDNVAMDWSVQRTDKWRRWIFFSREFRSYISYTKRGDQSSYYLKRWNGYLPRIIRKFVYFRPVRFLLSHSPVYQWLAAVETHVPPDQKITADLLHRKPDVIVVTPMNQRYSEEVEYVKAAKILNIPTVVPVISWDNLTTKGIFHVIPDLTLVWNEEQRSEAINIHSVPEENVFITGSPFFDKWFDASKLLEDRRIFCQRMGLDHTKPFFVYLGSSAKIARDETWLPQSIYNGLKSHSKTSIRNIGMLARPHPVNAKHYNQLIGDRLVVWPKDGALPEARDSQRDFYNALRHCEFTLGINTSGMIDAIVNAKPCLTVLTDQYQLTQEKTVHFRQLLQADVLDINHSPQEAIDSIVRLLDGEDRHCDQRQQFVLKFVRPHGLEIGAGKAAAQAIELIARGGSIDEIKASVPY